MLQIHPRPEGPEPAPGKPPAELPPETVWIDLLDPTPEEVEFVRAKTGVQAPSLADLSEIEASSQLSVDYGVLYLSLPMLAHADTEEAHLSYAGLILSPKLLVSVRFEHYKTFEAVAARACPQGKPTSSVEVFTALLEALVDRQADLLERARERLDQVGKAVFRSNTRSQRSAVRSNEALRGLLRELGAIAERISLIRDSLLGVGRIAPFAVENAQEWIEPAFAVRLGAVIKDIHSLEQFESHLSGKIQFLLDAVLGFISIEQNDIFKVLTIVSVIGVPPTLVASLYGMNFHNMPELGWRYGYPYALGLMVLTTVLPLVWFKWRGWL